MIEKSRFPKITRKSSLRVTTILPALGHSPLPASGELDESPKISALRHLARQLKLFELSSPHMNNAVVRLERSADLQNPRSAQQHQCAFFTGLARLHTRSD